LFITKKKYEEANLNKKLLEHLESTRPLCNEAFYFIDDVAGITQRYKNIKKRFENKELLDRQVVRIKGLLDSQIPFSTYYAERLEWWKGQFDKKPEPHKLRIDWDGDWEIICRDHLEDLSLLLGMFKEIDFHGNIEFADDETGHKLLIPKAKVKSYTIIPGHPDPYTPSEVETWAKEQLEKEMQGWKVVKEEQKETDYKKKYNDYQDVLHAAHQNELRNAESIMNNFWQTYADRYKELLSKCVRRHDTNINQSDN